MGKFKKDKNNCTKNKIKTSTNNQMRRIDNPLIYESNRIFKKFILKLRTKIKYSLLTCFNSKK